MIKLENLPIKLLYKKQTGKSKKRGWHIRNKQASLKRGDGI